MPKVPQAIAGTSYQSPSPNAIANPSEMTTPQRAGMALGQQGVQFGATLGEASAAMYGRDLVLAREEAALESTKNLALAQQFFRESLYGKTDEVQEGAQTGAPGYLQRQGEAASGVYRQGMQSAAEFLSSLREGMKPEARSEFDKRVLPIWTHYGDQLSSHEARQFMVAKEQAAKILVAESLRNVATYPEASVSGETDTARERFISDVSRQILDVYPGQENTVGKAHVMDFVAAARLTSAQDLIQNNPGQAASYIEKHKGDLGGHYPTLMRAVKAKEEESRQTDAYAELYARHGGDARKMREALLDPEEMKRLGLTIRDASSIENLVSDLEKTRQAAYDKTEGDYVQLMTTRKLKKSQVLADLTAGKIDPRRAQYWVDAIDSHRDMPTDPMSYIRLEDRILRGVATPDEVIRAPGVNFRDKGNLLARVYAVANAEGNDAEKMAKEFVRHQLISTGPLGSPIPAEWGRVYEAYAAIDKYAGQAKKDGKPWGLDEYMRYAKQLAEQYRPTVQSKARDMADMLNHKATTMPPDKRSEAISVLKSKGKVVNEETIRQVMEAMP